MEQLANSYASNNSYGSSPAKATGKTIRIKYKNKILKIHVSDQQYGEMPIVQFKQKVWNQMKSFHQDFVGGDAVGAQSLILSASEVKSTDQQQKDTGFQTMRLSYEDGEEIEDTVRLHELRSLSLCLGRRRPLQSEGRPLKVPIDDVVKSFLDEPGPESKQTRSEELQELIWAEQERIDQENGRKLAGLSSAAPDGEMGPEAAQNFEPQLTPEQIEDQRFWNLVELLY